MNQVRKLQRVSRHTRSWVLANIIIDQNLIDEFLCWRAAHPKLKSAYRAGSLFLLNKKFRYKIPKRCYSVNMDTLRDFYYGEKGLKRLALGD